MLVSGARRQIQGARGWAQDQRSTIADVYQRHIRCANGFPLPERFYVLHIGMERILVNVLSGSSSHGAHFSLPSHSFPNIEIRLNLMVQYIIWASLLQGVYEH